MRSSADAIVVGGGSQGLAIAYNLAKRGLTDLVILEKGYLGGGATGRSAGGIGVCDINDPDWIRLVHMSLQIFETLSDELGYNILFSQNGWLTLANSEEEADDLRNAVKLQNSLRVTSRFLEPDQVYELAPCLKQANMCGASYHKRDGVALHEAVVSAYEHACRRLGVEIRPFSELVDITLTQGRVIGVKTNRGYIKTEKVVNAAGAFSNLISKRLGVRIPNLPYRHEAFVTEPLKSFLKPFIITSTGDFLFQTIRGEVLGGLGWEVNESDRPPSYDQWSSSRFTRKVARSLTSLIPQIRKVRMMRQWVGLYDITPDRDPIIGEAPGLLGYFQSIGWKSRGFMMAPIIGKLLSEMILDERPSYPLERFSIERFIGNEKPPID